MCQLLPMKLNHIRFFMLTGSMLECTVIDEQTAFFFCMYFLYIILGTIDFIFARTKSVYGNMFSSDLAFSLNNSCQ